MESDYLLSNAIGNKPLGILAKNIPTNNGDERLDALARSLVQPMPRRRALGLLVAGVFGFALSPRRALAGGGTVNPNLRYQLKDTPCTDDMCGSGKICGIFSLPNRWGQKGCIKLGCCHGEQFCCAGPATVHGAVGGCCPKGFTCDGGKCVCNGTLVSQRKLSWSERQRLPRAEHLRRDNRCVCPDEQVCGSNCCKKGVPCIHNECCSNERLCGASCCKEDERCVQNEVSSASSSSSSGREQG